MVIIMIIVWKTCYCCAQIAMRRQSIIEGEQRNEVNPFPAVKLGLFPERSDRWGLGNPFPNE